MLPLEAVPNFSEGRDRATIDAIGEALSAHARLLDVHSDADHNRSVYTLVGNEDELVAALLAGIACARERIDLRGHEGAHPRIGAADVVPLVPIRESDAERARAAALALARRVGEELALPVFLYADLAAAAGPRSSVVAAPPSCSGASTRESSLRISARRSSTRGGRRADRSAARR